MSRKRKYSTIRGRALAASACVGLLLAAPSAVFALNGGNAVSFASSSVESAARFTPSSVDPELARRVNARLGAMGQRLPFTPAGAGNAKKPVTVAVRVDGSTARAITVRGAIRSAQSAPSAAQRIAIAIAPSRYNLGVARGYQSFAKPLAEPAKLAGVGKLDMPALDAVKPSEPSGAKKPSRFKPRIALEQEAVLGRAPGTLEAKGDQSLDVSGAYSITRNLDVKAGVRLSTEPNRTLPLTDSVQDSQAVYVGTQFRF